MLKPELLILAIRAHNFISFDPEKRGQTIFNDCCLELSNDVNFLKSKQIPDEQIQRYIEKYSSLFSCWMSAKSNCISSFITGGSNFPVKRAEKANNREHGHLTAFIEWRKKALKAIIKHNTAPVNEFEKAKKDLVNCEKLQEVMKAANKIIKTHKLTEENYSILAQQLINIGISKDTNFWKLFEPDFCGRIGFPAYALQNNLQNIHRLRDRVKFLESKEKQKGTAPEITINNVRIVHNFDMDRVQMFFNGKPKYEIIQRLKGRGFHWSPSTTSWMRKITNDAIYYAEDIAKTN